MKKYRRIEVNAFRHRVTVVSGRMATGGPVRRTDDAMWREGTEFVAPTS